MKMNKLNEKDIQKWCDELGVKKSNRELPSIEEILKIHEKVLFKNNLNDIIKLNMIHAFNLGMIYGAYYEKK